MNLELLLIVIILVYIFTCIKFSKENYSSTGKPIRENYSSIVTKIINEESSLNKDNFDVYLINMTKNVDRLQNFNKHYNKSDIAFKKFKVFPAIVGKNLNLINFVTPKAYEQIIEVEKTTKRRHHYDLTRGAVGCYLSHLSIYKKIIDSDKEYGIIFEDDSIMASDFYERLQYGINNIPDDWDIFLLGLTCLKCDIKLDYINVIRFWGTHGYIIKNKSAKKLLEYLDRPLSKQIDADISLLIKRKVIKVYGINPIIVAQEGSFKSDIQMDVIDSSEAFNEEFKQNQLNKFRQIKN
jgi:glycosyl transferase family 25